MLWYYGNLRLGGLLASFAATKLKKILNVVCNPNPNRSSDVAASEYGISGKGYKPPPRLAELKLRGRSVQHKPCSC